MSDLNVTKIDLTEISLDSLDGLEASGGNWKKGKDGYYYKIVAPKAKCAIKPKEYFEGNNSYDGKRVADCCSSCGNLKRVSTYWVCAATKRKSL